MTTMAEAGVPVGVTFSTPGGRRNFAALFVAAPIPGDFITYDLGDEEIRLKVLSRTFDHPERDGGILLHCLVVD